MLRFVVALAIACIAGCAAPADPGRAKSIGSVVPAACCTTEPPYPDWLVAVVDPVAPLVGRAIALVELRRGYLADRSDALDFVLQRLRPLDIVLVSSNGRLSGRAIPGLFSHTAIYLGTERQLDRLGFWNDPSVSAWRSSIRSGKVFIEADHKGVHLSPAANVLNTDSLMVIRPRLARESCSRDALALLMNHIGTRFDFRMDAGESDRLFCAELAHHVLPQLSLPITRLYGRDTIIPDGLAATALSRRSRLDVVAYVRGTPDGWGAATTRQAIADLYAAWPGGR